MNPLPWKKLLPWIIAIMVFMVIAITYFNPVLEGKKLKQDDIIRHKGMSKEIVDFRTKYGKEPLWTNSMFGGMPAYQISTKFPGNLTRYFDSLFQLGLPHPANLVFLYALGFFILLIVLGVNPWLAIAGAVGFAFSSYFFIILEAGHNSKAHAIGYMAPVIAGILLTYRGKYLAGGILTALFLALEISANHFQITYYLMILVLILSVGELIRAILDKKITAFVKSIGVLLVASIVAIGPNLSNLWTTYEYSKYTIRGASDLSVNKENKTSGLDKDYATDWSYGVDESFTLLIPNFKGGSSHEPLGRNSELYKVLTANNVPNADEIIKGSPAYWGPQPFTSGPVYVGAIFIFLFVMGLFVVKGPMKWGLLAATLLSLLLSWGKHIPAVTDFFLNYVPLYNKFRAVSMTLVIAELTIPLLGILAVNELIIQKNDSKKTLNALKLSFIIIGGISLFFALLPGVFYNFTGAEDAQMKASGYPDWFINSLVTDRQSMLRSDAFRSFIFITLAAAILWTVIQKKLKVSYAIAALAVLILIDMWGVNHRYINNDNFVRKSIMNNPYELTPADELILKDPDPNFRVLNLATNTFNDASTSYYHKSIGGYHGAKLRRYQELIDNQIAKNNMEVLNMLNTKYFIVKQGDAAPAVQPNPQALGNAWLVKAFKLVDNADAEMAAMDKFNPADTAIIDKAFEGLVKAYTPGRDSLSYIKLTEYLPNHLSYEYQASRPEMAVFSEIYYDKGWKALIDGKQSPYFRTNFLLRGMVVPEGKHKIEFIFEPASYITGEKVAMASSILLIVLVIGLVAYQGYAVLRKPAAKS